MWMEKVQLQIRKAMSEMNEASNPRDIVVNPYQGGPDTVQVSLSGQRIQSEGKQSIFNQTGRLDNILNLNRFG